MGRIVTQEDIDLARDSTISVAVTSTQAAPSRLGLKRRISIQFENTSATTVTLHRGDDDAVTSAGIRLTQNAKWIDADDAGYKCWQGAWQAIGSGASTLIVSEVIER